MNTYMHVTDSMQENVANTMGNLLGKSNKRTKSHFVKKSEIFYCKLNFEMHFRKRKNLRKRSVYAGFGADSRTRTDGLLITNELLYQLSYSSIY